MMAPPIAVDARAEEVAARLCFLLRGTEQTRAYPHHMRAVPIPGPSFLVVDLAPTHVGDVYVVKVERVR